MRQPDGRSSLARHWVYRRGLATQAVTAPITVYPALIEGLYPPLAGLPPM